MGKRELVLLAAFIALGVAGVPWTRWFGIIWRFQLLILLMSMGMVAFAVLYGYR